MDNSSRNIVIFIATITFSAMLLMAAHFYADWKKAETAPAAPAVVAAPVAEEPSVEETPATEEEGEEFPEDEDYPPMGEPMVDLEENGSSAPAAAPPLPAPQPANEQQLPEGYEANN
jgi:hypothetical protein